MFWRGQDCVGLKRLFSLGYLYVMFSSVRFDLSRTMEFGIMCVYVMCVLSKVEGEVTFQGELASGVK